MPEIFISYPRADDKRRNSPTPAQFRPLLWNDDVSRFEELIEAPGGQRDRAD